MSHAAVCQRISVCRLNSPRRRSRMNRPRALTRRDFLHTSGFGIGGLALTYLLHQEGLSAAEHAAPARSMPQDLRPRRGHFPARATAMVHFMQNGGPSQMDLF